MGELIATIMGMLNSVMGMFSNDIGIDLGTANTLVYVKDKGIVLREPSVVAIHNTDRKVIAVGDDAKRMLGRTPASITAIRPMKDGVIADFDISEAMLRYFINKVKSSVKFVPVRVVIAVPSGITEVERRAVRESATHAGASSVLIVEEPKAAAIGVGLPVAEPAASMIVDIGGGTTEVAILSYGDVVYSKSIRVGGDEFDLAITNYMKREFNIMVGERTAEEIKIRIGSATPLDEELSVQVRGRDAVSGLPRTVTVTSAQIRTALMDNLGMIVEVVKNVMERCPPELSGDLVDRGFFLAGGGALIRNIDNLLSEATGVPVTVADDPLSAVANGTGFYLEHLNVLEMHSRMA